MSLVLGSAACVNTAIRANRDKSGVEFNSSLSKHL